MSSQRISGGHPWRWETSSAWATLCAAALLGPFSLPAPGQVETLISESFDGEPTSGLVLPHRADTLCGAEAPAGTNSACIDDLAMANGGAGLGRLYLTQAFNHQTGYFWFTKTLDLPADKITV